MNINTVRERVGAVSEIVKVLPVSMPSTEATPSGLAFVMLVITDASDETLAAACGIEPGGVEPLFEEAAPVEADGGPPSDDDAPAALTPPRSADEVGDRWNLLRVDVTHVDAVMDLVFFCSRSSPMLAAGDDDRSPHRAGRRHPRASPGRHRSRSPTARAPDGRAPGADGPVHRRPRSRPADRARPRPLDEQGGEARDRRRLRGVLDKSVAERVFPAIVHLVRNAVDHGIEAPAVRRAAGKPPEGLLRITCSATASRRLELTVEDDGGGIDREAVAARAGAPVPETDAALLELLARPGLSTAPSVTTTSGRGMGMDIVERVVVHQLGGQLELSTERGVGTTFRLQIPLTVAIVDVFVIERAGRRFATPVAAVEEILEIDPASALRAPGPDGQSLGLVERRGVAMPLADLATVLGLHDDGPAPTRAVVVRKAGEAVAFLVNRVVGQQEAVVRPLVDPLVRVRGVPGATDLGDGKPTLLLDLPALARPLGARGPRALGGRPAPPLLPPRSVESG